MVIREEGLRLYEVLLRGKSGRLIRVDIVTRVMRHNSAAPELPVNSPAEFPVNSPAGRRRISKVPDTAPTGCGVAVPLESGLENLKRPHAWRNMPRTDDDTSSWETLSGSEDGQIMFMKMNAVHSGVRVQSSERQEMVVTIQSCILD